MKVSFILNGQSETREIPTNWDQVDFNTFLKMNLTEPVDVLSALWEIDKDLLKRATIKNFDDVAFTLSFLKTPPDVATLPKTILGYEVPKDLNFDQVGRYWDIKMIYDSFVKGDKYEPDLKQFPEIVAIAIMPDYLDAKKEEQEAFITKLGTAPCGEVLAIANFCLTKLILLNLRTALNSSITSTPKRKWLQGILNWYRNLAITVRLWLWKRKLRLHETKYSK